MKKSLEALDLACSNYYGLSSLRPLVQEFQRRGIVVRLFIFGQRLDPKLCAQYLNLELTSIHADFGGKKIRMFILHCLDQAFRLAHTSPHFSSMYRKILAQEKSRGFWKWFSRLTHFFPKTSSPNHHYYHFFKFLVPQQKKPVPVLATSLLHAPYWLCQKKAQVHLLVDSWDHPVKMPFFLNPRATYAWNEDLAQDVRKLQKLGQTQVTYPFRFHYIFELKNQSALRPASPHLQKHLSELPLQFMVYAMGSFSNYPELFSGEEKLIWELIKIAEEINIPLYIKPRPDSGPATFESFKKNKMVIIGPTKTAAGEHKVLPDLVIDQDYNIYRFLLLQRARLLINVGTTLIFEGALVGTPILQMDLSSSLPEMKGFIEWTDNPHLKKYIKPRASCFRYELTGDSTLLKKEIQDYLHDESKAQLMSQELKEWIMPQASFTTAVEQLLQDLQV